MHRSKITRTLTVVLATASLASLAVGQTPRQTHAGKQRQGIPARACAPRSWNIGGLENQTNAAPGVTDANVYTSESGFLSHIQAGYYLEDFNGLATGLLGEPWIAPGAGGFGFTATTNDAGGLWVLSPGTPTGPSLSTNSSLSKLVITFTGTPVTALGGYFASTDADGNILQQPVVVQLSDGSSAQLEGLGFRGFTSTVAIASLTIDGLDAPLDNFPALDHLYVGTRQAGGTLTLDTNVDHCYQLNDTITVAINLNADTNIVGGQFFLQYNPAKLSFVDIVPGDPPFTNPVYDSNDPQAGTIDYAVGVPPAVPPNPGAMTGTMAVARFRALADECGEPNLVRFRDHNPPTRLTQFGGTPLPVGTVSLPALTVHDQTGPVVTPPPPQTVECDGLGNTVELALWKSSATANDACFGPLTPVYVEESNTPGCGGTRLITAHWEARDRCNNLGSSAPSTFAIQDTTAPTLTIPESTTVECDGAGNTAALTAWQTAASAVDVCQGAITPVFHVDNVQHNCGITQVITGHWEAADGCGNVAVSDSRAFTIQDTLPPTVVPPGNLVVDCDGAGNTEAFDEWQAGATARDTCGGVLTPTYVLVSDIPGACAGTRVVTAHWTATDPCGNVGTSANRTFTIRDITPPVITCPGDINVDADAGRCDATLDPGTATATDGCDANPVVIGTRSDGLALNAAYPSGSTTTITWTATDACGNSAQCVQSISVATTNAVDVVVVLSPTIVPAALERCITFEFWNCPGAQPTEVAQPLLFVNGVAHDVLHVPCGPYTCVTARDKLHTLRRTIGLQTNGVRYGADFTALSLIGGNLNDDEWIDILDFGVLIAQWETPLPPDTACNTPAPHSDINGDGVVDSADFTFIQINFLLGNDQNCCGFPGGPDSAPVTRISVAELIRRGLGQLVVADLNGDGWLDTGDVAAFMAGARPKPTAKLHPASVSPVRHRPSGG